MDKPDRRIHRFLLSTTSRFVSEYESDLIRIDHSWPAASSHYGVRVGLTPGPYSRNYFVLSVAIEPPEKKSIVIPNYTPFAEEACAAMSVLYGKRFDNHGLLVSHQHFYVPDMGSPQPTTYYTAAPYSHEPRKDVYISLELHRFGAVAPLFTDHSLDQQFRRIFFAAARFYLRSLQIFDVEPEFAYLDLVTCGEILANFYDYPPGDLYDEQTKEAFGRIRAEIAGGDKIVGRLQSRLLQIKRRYTLTLRRLLTNSFFQVSECTESYGRLTHENIEKRLKAAYDVRSQYVHTGIEFGHWIHPHGGILNEVQLGTPVVENRDVEKALALAPTFLGLERIMRYCLLRFLHLNDVPIDPALDDATPAPDASSGRTEAAPTETVAEAPAESPPGAEAPPLPPAD